MTSAIVYNLVLLRVFSLLFMPIFIRSVTNLLINRDFVDNYFAYRSCAIIS